MRFRTWSMGFGMFGRILALALDGAARYKVVSIWTLVEYTYGGFKL